MVLIKAVTSGTPPLRAVADGRSIPELSELLHHHLEHSHGCFQGAQEFEQLSKHLDPNIDLYGIRSSYLTFERNEENLWQIAKPYALEISKIHPDTPIILGGNCQGGELMLMVAEELIKLGKSIHHFILIEKVCPVEVEFPITLLFWRSEFA